MTDDKQVDRSTTKWIAFCEDEKIVIGIPLEYKDIKTLEGYRKQHIDSTNHRVVIKQQAS